MTEHEQNLRDLASMFVMAGLLRNSEMTALEIVDKAHKVADLWLEARNPTQEGGIADITTKRKYGRKATD